MFGLHKFLGSFRPARGANFHFYIRFLFAFLDTILPAMNLFSQLAAEPTHEEIFPGAVLMRGLALDQDVEFFRAVESVMAAHPPHNTTTAGGLPMSVMVTDAERRMRSAVAGALGIRMGPLFGRPSRKCS